jgi:hypothetical protein
VKAFTAINWITIGPKTGYHKAYAELPISVITTYQPLKKTLYIEVRDINKTNSIPVPVPVPCETFSTRMMNVGVTDTQTAENG